MIQKTFNFALLSLALAVLGGCAAVEEPVSQVPERFEQGMRGQGQLITRDPMKDSFGSYYQ